MQEIFTFKEVKVSVAGVVLYYNWEMHAVCSKWLCCSIFESFVGWGLVQMNTKSTLNRLVGEL
jgi:hypothetical protein